MLRRKRDDEEALSERYQPRAIRADSAATGGIEEENGTEEMGFVRHLLRDPVLAKECRDVARLAG